MTSNGEERSRMTMQGHAERLSRHAVTAVRSKFPEWNYISKKQLLRYSATPLLRRLPLGGLLALEEYTGSGGVFATWVQGGLRDGVGQQQAHAMGLEGLRNVYSLHRVVGTPAVPARRWLIEPLSRHRGKFLVWPRTPCDTGCCGRSQLVAPT